MRQAEDSPPGDAAASRIVTLIPALSIDSAAPKPAHPPPTTTPFGLPLLVLVLVRVLEVEVEVEVDAARGVEQRYCRVEACELLPGR